MSPARACSFTVVRRVFEEGAYADKALAAEAVGLGPRDRALATQIAYGTVQRRATLDHVAQGLVSRKLSSLEPAVLAALRLGLFQLMYLGGVASHAAVTESVELAKLSSRGGAGLVNAVLRRAAAERGRLLDGLDDATPSAAAVMHSVPVWLAELWFEELGAVQARALLRRIDEPPESAIRVNSLAGSVEEVSARLPVPHHAAPGLPLDPTLGLPEGLVLEGPLDLEGSELWRDGLVTGQSRGSMLVARVLGPVPGERVLDLCAAPGTKTTHLAALMEDRGQVVAVDRHPSRASALRQNAARMGATCVTVRVADARVPLSETFDRVLVDPPCSGLGTLQSRPDRRWRATPESIEELAELQLEILRAAARVTRPGGTLVYSVCTISRREGEGVIERLLAERPEFSLVHNVQLLPHRDLTDGFFVARLGRDGR